MMMQFDPLELSQPAYSILQNESLLTMKDHQYNHGLNVLETLQGDRGQITHIWYSHV